MGVKWWALKKTEMKLGLPSGNGNLTPLLTDSSHRSKLTRTVSGTDQT